MTVVRSLCVYCGSADRVDEIYRAAARRLGTLLGENRIELVYGGGRVGLMGVVADAALAAGGRVVGIIPAHLHEREVGHHGVSVLEVVDSMHERKRRMFGRADAFAVLPGGMGTLDETFEMITWRQLGLHDKPIIIVNVQGYWAPLLGMFDHLIAAGFAAPAARRLFSVVGNVEDLLPALASAPAPRVAAESDLV
ncbi:MAG TPA: TIGR00730 family Rossman fold protein [Stellaceae bacterium]|nr:TIGR00730 family Rossman fold protein [Stellaceae bacterium]